MGNNNSSSGAGLGSLLLVAFIVLKLCKVIAWSWWWVMSPLWIGAAVWILAFGFGVFFIVNRHNKRKSRPPELSKWGTRLREMQIKQQEKRKSDSSNGWR